MANKKRVVVRTEMTVRFKVTYDDGMSFQIDETDGAPLVPEEVIYPDQVKGMAESFLKEANDFAGAAE